VDGEPIGRHFETLAHKLRDVRDAFDSRDYVLLADVLEFEMPETCRRWSGLLEALATQLDSDV
jgi:hypothetical protein